MALNCNSTEAVQNGIGENYVYSSTVTDCARNMKRPTTQAAVNLQMLIITGLQLGDSSKTVLDAHWGAEKQPRLHTKPNTRNDCAHVKLCSFDNAPAATGGVMTYGRKRNVLTFFSGCGSIIGHTVCEKQQSWPIKENQEP
jgi:hypothetical protein